MQGKNNKNALLTMVLFGGVMVIFFALHIAPHAGDGLAGIITSLNAAMDNPFNISFCEDSLRTVLICLGIYGMGMGIYFSTRRNYRHGEEYGSAKWGSAAAINRKYRERKVPEANNILTQNVSMGLNDRKHDRNLNTVVLGGSGTKKTRSYAKPNVMQCNCSMVVIDPKGEILRDTGWLLKAKGYKIRVLDLIEPWRSHCFNPFVYIRNDDDVQKIATILMKATDTKKSAATADPFWDRAAEMLLKALMFYLYHYAPEDEQNFPMVMELLRAAAIPDEESGSVSPLDILFQRLQLEDPGSIALKYYRDYRSGAAKTLKSIQITLAARLEKFNLESITGITAADELDLRSLGEEKTALFCKIPDNDTSYNFLISILYMQIFQQLYDVADNKYHGRVPIPVHFLMDEFANITLPEDFQHILATIRSRGGFISIILQTIAQIKELYKESWENVIGNCDTFLYLGGNEPSTYEFMSKLLDKATIDTKSYGRTRGRNGSYTTNYQQTGRELMKPDEVRMLDNRYGLLYIRGERPVMDLKYDLLRHPNIALTADGGQPPYIHGETTLAKATISLAPAAGAVPLNVDAEALTALAERYELLTEAELEEQSEKEERKKKLYEKRKKRA